MKNKIKISIIMPIYNAERYLKEALDSVISQTLKEIEIICVNDGSTDNSLEILKTYAEKDSRIKIITGENKGWGYACNTGISASNGKYIGFVESDDFIEQDMFETLYNVAEKNQVEIIKSDYIKFSTDGDPKKNFVDKLDRTNSYYNRIINPKDDVFVFNFRINIWTGIYLRTFIEQNKIRMNETPGASYQDNGFWFQTFCYANKIYFLDKVFYHYRQDNPESSVNSKEKVFCICDEYNYIREFLEQHPEYKSKFLNIYTYRKYHNYMFTYNRIGEEYKQLFLSQFGKEFRLAKENNEIDFSMFKENELLMLDKILKTE